MTTRLISHLRHVDLAVPDFDKQRDFFTGLWGLTEVGSEDGISYLAAEGSPEQYIVRLRRDSDKRLDLISFGANTPADIDALATQLGHDGVQLVSEPGSLQTPGAGYGFRFFDVDGRTIEVSADVEVREHRQIEERESIPVRLSHVVVNSPTPEATFAFYEKHLSFSLSDTLMHPRMGNMMWFTRCNNRHHSMAIAKGPHTALHHVSFEMRGIDEYMRGTGRLLRAGVEKLWGPGRHKAGNNTFSYFLDPHGNTVEYTTELETVDEDTWHPSLHDFTEPDVSDQWGTANEMNEFVAAKSFNDPDKGVFVARRSDPAVRIARVADDDGRPVAAVVVDDVVYLSPGEDPVQLLIDAVDGPEAMLTALAASGSPTVPLAEARLLAPLDPPTMRDFVAFEEHVEGMRKGAGPDATVPPEWYAAPAFYFTNPYAVVGPYDDVPVPPGCQQFDFELEVAAIVGFAGRDLTPEQGRDAIVGYTILNDWSARDLQRAEMRVNLGPAKGKDTSTTLGPWIVTPDELAPYLDDDGFLALPMTVEVNGTEIGRDLLSNMGWPFGDLVAHASRGTWVKPGDVLGSGTCGNGGCLAELWGRGGGQTPPPLQPGDVVTMTVGGIGTIRNTVVAGGPFNPVSPARPRPRTRP